MKIIYFLPTVNPAAGIERVLSVKTDAFVKKGHEITIVTSNKEKFSPFFIFNDKIKFINLNIFRKRKNENLIQRISTRLHYSKEKYLYQKEVKNLLFKEKYDVAITLCIGEELHFLFKIKDNSAKIAEYHFSYEALFYRLKNLKGRLLKLNKREIEKRILSFSMYEKFVALTKEDSINWKNVISNVEYIYNPVSFKSEKFPNYAKKETIAIGRLSEQKGYDYMIEIWKVVTETHPEWVLKIFGEGDQEEKLKKIIKDYNLERNIKILSVTPRIELELLKSSLFIMTSRFEGLPLALMEAMSVGLAAVSFNTPCGPSELIKNGENGFITELYDIKDTAAKIKILLNDEERRKKYGYKSKMLSTQFAIDQVIIKWENLFIKLKNN